MNRPFVKEKELAPIINITPSSKDLKELMNPRNSPEIYLLTLGSRQQWKGESNNRGKQGVGSRRFIWGTTFEILYC